MASRNAISSGTAGSDEKVQDGRSPSWTELVKQAWMVETLNGYERSGAQRQSKAGGDCRGPIGLRSRWQN